LAHVLNPPRAHFLEREMEAVMTDFWLDRQVTWQDVVSNFILALATLAGLFVVSVLTSGLPVLG
jgi:hypothetical protein